MIVIFVLVMSRNFNARVPVLQGPSPSESSASVISGLFKRKPKPEMKVLPKVTVADLSVLK